MKSNEEVLLLRIEAAKAKVAETGKGLSLREIGKLTGYPAAVVLRDLGGGRQARQMPGANRYPARVRQAVNGALQTLARLEALTYFTDGQLAEYFVREGVKADRLLFLGEVLIGIGEAMKKLKPEEHGKCAECGGSLELLDGEARARYCSPSCRQKAFRKRRNGGIVPENAASVTNDIRHVEANSMSVTHENESSYIGSDELVP